MGSANAAHLSAVRFDRTAIVLLGVQPVQRSGGVDPGDCSAGGRVLTVGAEPARSVIPLPNKTAPVMRMAVARRIRERYRAGV